MIGGAERVATRCRTPLPTDVIGLALGCGSSPSRSDDFAGGLPLARGPAERKLESTVGNGVRDSYPAVENDPLTRVAAVNGASRAKPHNPHTSLPTGDPIPDSLTRAEREATRCRTQLPTEVVGVALRLEFESPALRRCRGRLLASRPSACKALNQLATGSGIASRPQQIRPAPAGRCG